MQVASLLFPAWGRAGRRIAKSKKAGRLDGLAAQIRACTRCPLHESRTLAVPGDGKYTAKVMIIGEVRGRVVEREGRKFLVGYHPAVRFYREDLGEKVREDFALLKRELKKL